jgi:hypothetical protein
VDSLLQGNDGRKTWIPDQVGDDKKSGFPIDTFGNDRGSREGQTISVIPHLMRNPGFMNLLLEKVRKVIIPKIRFAIHIETCFLTD